MDQEAAQKEEILPPILANAEGLKNAVKEMQKTHRVLSKRIKSLFIFVVFLKCGRQQIENVSVIQTRMLHSNICQNCS